MGSFSLMHWIIVLGIIVLLFGAGRLSHVMGDFAKGIKAFKAGLKDDEPGEQPAGQVPPPNPAVASSASTSAADHPPGRA
jgi:sec-independent protein translocase protein TatA